MSVHGLSTRTTSSLESYNAWVGKIFPKNGNFFRFVQILNREIDKNYIRFRSAIKDQSFFHFPGKTLIKERNENIAKCSQLLNEGIYGVDTFLKQVTFLNVVPATTLETSPNDDDLEMTICDITNDDNSTKCTICHLRERVVAYLPCYHLAQCAVCEIRNNCIICGATDVTAVAFNTTN